MLKDHQILFDAECPMCKLYTKAIVSAGILDKSGRVAYQEVDEDTCPMLDRQRAMDEIALINYQTGEVTYGIHSLFKVIAVAVPAMNCFFSFQPFVWLMEKVYAFISYNRRVIVPPQVNSGSFQLQPTFRLSYRIAYIVFALLLTGCVLSVYSKLFDGIIPHGNEYREYVICCGQVLCQGLVILIINRDQIWTYLGNMMTVSLAGALLLLPMIWLSSWSFIHPMTATFWFLAVVGLMFMEHIRRCKLLDVRWLLTISWVLYMICSLVAIMYV